jgi:hypothetical protein
MKGGAWVALAAALLLLFAAFVAAPAARAGPAPALTAASTASNLTGSISGPKVIRTNGDGFYDFNATGGAAYASNGTLVGNLTFYATVVAGNTSGVTITPSSGTIANGTYRGAALQVNNVSQVLTLSVEITSVYQTTNDSINLTYAVSVVQPYVVAATIFDRASATVLSFVVTVSLDGAPVGSVTVPSLTSGTSYDLSFDYVTLGLASGWHTFSLTLAAAHGLVTFTNGSTFYAVSFYIPGATPDYTLWYVAGVVAFFGVLFIFATRVAARRRGVARK